MKKPKPETEEDRILRELREQRVVTPAQPKVDRRQVAEHAARERVAEEAQLRATPATPESLLALAGADTRPYQKNAGKRRKAQYRTDHEREAAFQRTLDFIHTRDYLEGEPSEDL